LGFVRLIGVTDWCQFLAFNRIQARILIRRGAGVRRCCHPSGHCLQAVTPPVRHNLRRLFSSGIPEEELPTRPTPASKLHSTPSTTPACRPNLCQPTVTTAEAPHCPPTPVATDLARTFHELPRKPSLYLPSDDSLCLHHCGRTEDARYQ